MTWFHGPKIAVFWLKITTSGVLKSNRSFFFVTWFHSFFGNFWWFHEYFCMKTWNLGWFHEKRKSKNIETHLVPRLGPQASAPASAPREARGGGRSWGLRAQSRHQMGFNIFLIFRFSWIPPKVFKFSCKNIREYHQKFPKNEWNPGLKIKKIRAVYIEIPLWWYFGQKYSQALL